MLQNERPSAFVMVTCPCGRSLRAKWEQVGTEVRCWDCHRMVPVPIPHQGREVARELKENALTVMQGPGLNAILGTGAIVTAVLAIPGYGAWCSAVALTLVASVYGEMIRRGSLGPDGPVESSWAPSLLPRSIPKLVPCLLLAAGTVIPLWLRNAAPGQSPHWDGVGLAIAALAWVVVPLLMLMACARTHGDAPLGFRGGCNLLRRHPFSMLATLAVVPLGLLLIEAGIGLTCYLPGNLPFFALDFMPMPSAPEKPVMFDGIPHYRLIDYRSLPDSTFLAGYANGLRGGYSFVGAIPASLSLPTRGGMSGELIGLSLATYAFVRVLLVMVIVTCLLTAFAIQARWLGSLAALDRRLPGRRPEVSPSLPNLRSDGDP